jgi:hypothetical protein
MNTYAHKLGDRWYGFIQSPLGIWVPLERYADTKESMEDYLKSLGFTIVQR